MGRRAAVLAVVLLGSCDTGTVNNGEAFFPSTFRASEPASGGDANGNVVHVHVSGDGRRVVFISGATNMHPDDADNGGDVFVKDLVSGDVFLANRATGPAGAKVGGILTARLSGDGGRVVFDSFSSLHPDDTDGNLDVYVRDLATHETILASRATGLPGAKGNGSSKDPDISPDGRFVVFVSSSTNLSAADGDGLDDVFLRDLLTGTTELVSRAGGAAGAKGNGFCSVPRVSADGSRVSFLSQATNLVVPATSTTQVFLRDRTTFDTLLVSRATGAAGAEANQGATGQSLSADGRRVAFVSTSSNLEPADPDSFTDVFVRDLYALTTELASRATGTGGVDLLGSGANPSISGNGRFVSFSTISSSFGEPDENLTHDIYVRDTLTARTFRVSVKTFGGEVVGNSFLSALSGDGRTVAFVSAAAELIEGDGNSAEDAFVRRPLW